MTTTPHLYKVPQVMAMLSMSRSTLYAEMSSGRLRSIKRGRSRLISAAAVADYIALLERESAQVA